MALHVTLLPCFLLWGSFLFPIMQFINFIMNDISFGLRFVIELFLLPLRTSLHFLSLLFHFAKVIVFVLFFKEFSTFLFNLISQSKICIKDSLVLYCWIKHLIMHLDGYKSVTFIVTKFSLTQRYIIFQFNVIIGSVFEKERFFLRSP